MLVDLQSLASAPGAGRRALLAALTASLALLGQPASPTGDAAAMPCAHGGLGALTGRAETCLSPVACMGTVTPGRPTGRSGRGVPSFDQERSSEHRRSPRSTPATAHQAACDRGGTAGQASPSRNPLCTRKQRPGPRPHSQPVGPGAAERSAPPPPGQHHATPGGTMPRRHPSGKLQGCYKIDGHRYYLTGRLFEDHEEVECRVAEKVARKEHLERLARERDPDWQIEQRRATTTIADYAKTWPEPDQERPARNTNDHYRQQIQHLVRAMGDKVMDRVTVREARQFAKQHREAAKVASVMWGDAREDELVTRNPWSKLRISRGNGRKHLNVMSLEQFDKLLVACGEVFGDYGRYMVAILLTAALVTCRPSELIALRWEDVDYERKLVFIDEQREGRHNEYTDTKTHAESWVGLPDAVAEALQRLDQGRPRDFVFVTKTGIPFTYRNLMKYWEDLRDHLGIGKLDLYTLRHLGLSLGADQGLTAFDLSIQATQSDGGRTAQQRYIHPIEHAPQQRFVAAINRIRPGSGCGKARRRHLRVV
jgi:integrase